MILAQILQHGLVQRPRASSRLFPGQDAVVSRRTQDPAMPLAWVRASEEDYMAPFGVGPVGSMLRIGQQPAEERVGGMASTARCRRGET
jgi:hypothetical protein